jgi:uncharacterized protein
MTSAFGRFTWYDYFATDVDAAAKFYGAVVGWKTVPWGEGDKPYQMLSVGERGAGGIMELPAQAKAMGAPPHWVGYVIVADCDATAAKAAKLGGAVLAPPFDMPTIGRCAILADADGASFGIIQPETEMGLPYDEEAAPPGFIGWNELMCADYTKSMAFFGELFGWVESDAMDMGGMIYQLFKLSGMEHATGGMMNRPAEMPRSTFMHYIMVDEIDAAVGRVKAAGGTVNHGPMAVPSGTRIIICTDPQGGAFALMGK